MAKTHKFMLFAHKFITLLSRCTYAVRMTYSEFQRQLGKAGLTIREFSELLQMSRNSLTNYAAGGDIPSHLAVIVTLMAEMAEHGLGFRDAVHKIKIQPKKPRGAASNGRFGAKLREVRGLCQSNKEENT